MKIYSGTTGMLAIAITAITSTVSCSPAQSNQLAPHPEMAQALRKVSDDLELNGFSGVLAVSVKGEVIFERSIASDSVPPGSRIDGLTQIDIGSIVKPFTGTILSNLIAEGIVDADLTIGDVFADAPSEKSGITLHQLLTHSSGLPGAVGFDHDIISREEILDMAFGAELMFAPGEGYGYSNTGFTLAAIVAEEVTGETYDELLRRYALDPAGLTSTGYEAAYDDARAARNHEGFSVREASWGGHAPSWAIIGNGGMVSTARDLLAFGQYMSESRSRGHEWTRIMIRPLIEEGGQRSYGYGIVLEPSEAFGSRIWHNGGNPFFRSELHIFDDTGVVIVLHHNDGDFPMRDAADQAANAVFGLPLEPINRPTEVIVSEQPDTDAGRLATAFVVAINSSKASDWQAFVETYGAPDFIALFPMEEHLRFFHQVHNDFGQAAIVGYAEGEGSITVYVQQPGHPRVPLRIHLSDQGGTPKFAGVEVS